MTISPHLPAPDPSAKVARLKAIRDETTADHCSHGVARTNCTTHREHKPPADHGHTPTEHTEHAEQGA